MQKKKRNRNKTETKKRDLSIAADWLRVCLFFFFLLCVLLLVCLCVYVCAFLDTTCEWYVSKGHSLLRQPDPVELITKNSICTTAEAMRKFCGARYVCRN